MTAPDRRQASTRLLDPEFQATPAEIGYFMFGSCHRLAFALHQRTGWPLAGCGWRYWSGDDEEGYEVPEHVFVIAPDDQGVDIYGKHPRGEHPDPGISDDWAQFDAEDIIKLMGEDEVYLPVGAVERVVSRMFVVRHG